MFDDRDGGYAGVGEDGGAASPTAVADVVDSYTAEAAAELAAIEDELKRREWLADPRKWARERIGFDLWSKQALILASVAVNRRTAVKSCHGVGKSVGDALLAAWWIDCHPPGSAFVITSAPSGRQVKAILWRWIGRIQALLGRGRTNLTEWYLEMPDGREELVAFGQKPADMDPTAFQGIHARFILVILDEACGMPKALCVAADSLISSEGGRLIMTGNPDDPATEFAEACKPGSGFNVITISAFDTPAFTGEAVSDEIRNGLVSRVWVEEKRKQWAKDWRWNADRTRCDPPKGAKVEDANPFWLSKVLALFPKAGSGLQLLLPIPWIEAACERSLAPVGPSELGVDCGAGGDASTTGHRRGPVFRILSADHNPDTMQTTGKIVAELEESRAELVKVDAIGIGKGVVDRLAEQKKPVVPIVSGARAADPEHFANWRAESWWAIRDRFESGDIDIDPNDHELLAELSSICYKRTSRGQILIESKDEAKRRGVASPNKADCLMFAFSVPPQGEIDDRKWGLVW